MLVGLYARFIGKTFHIPTFDPMEETKKEYTENMWKVNPLKCKKLINQYWLKEKRGSANKVPQELFRSNFYEGYHDLVTFLSRVMGIPTAAYFQDWMFYFIEIIKEKAKFHWAKIISDNLHQ